MDCFTASVALREHNSITARLRELGQERASSWRDREIKDLRDYLLEVKQAISNHRSASHPSGN